MDALNHWDHFTLRVPISASSTDVYNAWATPAGLERWFLRDASFTDKAGAARSSMAHITPGDRYRWLWHGYPDSAVEEGRIVSAKSEDRLSFTFTGGCLVTVVLVREAGTLVVELTQTNFPPSNDPPKCLQYLCSLGWTFYLTNLKSVLEGGIDLRNRNAGLPCVITA